MKELLESFVEMLREKSSLTRIFLLSFLATNWVRVYTLLFSGDDVTTRDKIVAAIGNIPIHVDNHYADTFLDVLWVLGWPAVLTYIIVRWYPPLQNSAFSYALRGRYERKKMVDDQEAAYQQQKSRILQVEARAIQSQSQSKKEIDEALSQEEKWDDEYRRIREQLVSAGFSKIIEAIYDNGGQIGWNNDRLSTQALAVGDTKGLLSIDVSANTISLTDKGKYIAGLYLEDRPND
jgi:hypothetical protein